MMLPTFNQYMYLQHSSTVKRFTCMSMIAYMYMCGYIYTYKYHLYARINKTKKFKYCVSDLKLREKLEREL